MSTEIDDLGSLVFSYVTNDGRKVLIRQQVLSEGQNQGKSFINFSWDNSSSNFESFAVPVKNIKSIGTFIEKTAGFFVESLICLEPKNHIMVRELWLSIIRSARGFHSYSTVCESSSESEIVRVLAEEIMRLDAKTRGTSNADFISNHLNIFNNKLPVTAEQFNMFYKPWAAQHGAECFPYLAVFPGLPNLVAQDKDARESFHRIYSVQANSDPSMATAKISDFPLIPLSEIEDLDTIAFWQIVNLPVHNLQFRNYVNTLAKDEFFQILGKIGNNVGDEASAQASKIIVDYYRSKIKNTLTNSFAFANEVAVKFFSLFFQDCENADNAVESYKIFMNHYNNSVGLRIMNAALDSKAFAAENACVVRDYFLKFPEIGKKCVSENISTEVVARLLLTKMSEVRAMEMILATIEFEELPALGKWIEYVERYEEFRDTPISWWTLLV